MFYLNTSQRLSILHIKLFVNRDGDANLYNLKWNIILYNTSNTDNEGLIAQLCNGP